MSVANEPAVGDPVLLGVVHAGGVFSANDCARVVAIAERVGQRTGLVERNESKSGIRNSDVSFLTRGAETGWLYDRLLQVVAQLNRQYWRFDLTGVEPLQVAAYGPDQHYTWHTDLAARSPGNRRKLSISIQLSDAGDYDGGTFESFASSSPLAAPRDKGAIIAFPSYVLHRVTPVTRGVRRSLVGWFVGRGALR